MIERGILDLPSDADVTSFLLSYGKRSNRVTLSKILTLRDLFEKYQQSLPNHAKEASSLETEEIHLGHFRKHMPLSKPLTELTTEVVQAYVNKQLRRKIRNRPIKSETVKRQMDTLRGIFNWAIKQQLYAGSNPTSGLVLPKRDEQPPLGRGRKLNESLLAGDLLITKWQISAVTLSDDPGSASSLGVRKSDGSVSIHLSHVCICSLHGCPTQRDDAGVNR